MYGIVESIYGRLQTYFQSNRQIEQVVLFGSRAKGLQTLTSDIDLCITYTGTHRGHIVFEIQDLVGVYEVDIVFADKLSEDLSAQITRDGQVIYTKEG